MPLSQFWGWPLLDPGLTTMVLKFKVSEVSSEGKYYATGF
ncbi:hypothetical protein A2U01_0089745, partial [Trifolium medium]|nr:hypothetical protein [Trifolium medium]